MESVLIGIKRFFQNKNTVTILAILASLTILYVAYNARYKARIEPKNVPYATREIGPNSEITSDMVGTKKIQGGITSKNVLTNSGEIIGMYVKNTAVIPSGGVFYSEMLSTWDDLPTSVYGDIPEGYTIVALPVSIETTYGNSIYPGNYIDLYYAGYDENNLLMMDKFIESIRVLAVTDAKGENVFETNGDLGAPAYLIFSVNEDLHLLLRKASYLSGTIFPVPRNAEYSKDPKETQVVNSYIQQYITEQSINVAEQDSELDENTNGTNIEVLGGNN